MPKALVCRPELLASNLSDRNYLVTGGNSGIGYETALQLAKQGARVVLACRSEEAGHRAVASIQQRVPAAGVEYLQLDLSRLDSVRQAATEVGGRLNQLHGLVNNAGVMNPPLRRTQEGFELQFGVNHLGHFLLTNELLPLLKKSAPSRVVVLSSCFHDKAQGRPGKLDFEDLNYERRPYDGWEAYAQSKLANLLHAKALATRLEGTQVTAVSVHPGWVRTRLIRNSLPVWLQDTVLRPLLRTFGMIEPFEGAQTTLHTLLAPEVEQQAGAFFSQTGMYRDKSKNAGGWPLESPNPAAHDTAAAERLWTVSEKLTAA